MTWCMYRVGGGRETTLSMWLPWPLSSTQVCRELGSWSQESPLIDPESFLLEFLSQGATGQTPPTGLRNHTYSWRSVTSTQRKTELQRDTKVLGQPSVHFVWTICHQSLLGQGKVSETLNSTMWLFWLSVELQSKSLTVKVTFVLVFGCHYRRTPTHALNESWLPESPASNPAFSHHRFMLMIF